MNNTPFQRTLSASFVLSCAAIATLLTMPLAHAAVSASAHMAFSVVLIDLDPTDAISPSFTFGNGNTRVGGWAYIYPQTTTANGVVPTFDLIGTSPLADRIFVDHQDMEVKYQAAVDGNEGSTTGPHDFTLSASGTNISAPNGSQFLFHGTSTLTTEFTLSANTAAFFYADVDLSARIKGGYQTQINFFNDSASAKLSLEVFDQSRAHRDKTSFETAVNSHSTLCCGPYIPTGVYASDVSRLVSVALVNGSSSTMGGQVKAELTIAGREYMSPAPEAGTWAMALAGLGVLGLAHRRSRRA